MIKGTLAQQRNQKAEAEEYLKIAQEVKLPSDNERAMLELQLANIAATKNRMNQAKLHLRNAKKMNITEETIKDQLQQLEVAIKSYGASNTARMSGGKGQMRNPGGKRRRPKMR